MLHATRNRLERRRQEDGFTLIELLIVIVILAVLAAIVVFSVTGINNNSKTSACKADLNSINTAAEAYYAQNNSAAAHMGGTATNTLVGAGFLHNDGSISGDTKTGSGYTVTFTPGSGTGANAAGNATASC
jgi:prepilin-type N-terminal cleavage/methylation domain-containing protein